MNVQPMIDPQQIQIQSSMQSNNVISVGEMGYGKTLRQMTITSDGSTHTYLSDGTSKTSSPTYYPRQPQWEKYLDGRQTYGDRYPLNPYRIYPLRPNTSPPPRPSRGRDWVNPWSPTVPRPAVPRTPIPITPERTEENPVPSVKPEPESGEKKSPIRKRMDAIEVGSEEEKSPIRKRMDLIEV